MVRIRAGLTVSHSGDTPVSSPAKIALTGNPGCHLCDDAREIITRVARDLDAG
jgi:hypothetical protein